MRGAGTPEGRTPFRRDHPGACPTDPTPPGRQRSLVMHDLTERVPGYRHVITKRSFPHLIAECTCGWRIDVHCEPESFAEQVLAKRIHEHCVGVPAENVAVQTMSTH
jgi:hypothetical protein